VPILFLSARDEEIDRILGLEIGGDDYMTKPFSPRELVTRIGVIMRRSVKTEKPASDGGAGELAHADVRLDRSRHEATFANAVVPLTAIEFAIVAAFMQRPGHIFDRSRLMSSAYGGNIHVSDRTIDSHIRNVRAKFAAAGCASIIDTLHGIGFRLGRCTREPVAAVPAESGNP
jgi:two-component system OmpR family response regulator